MKGNPAEASTIQVVYSSALPQADLDELYEQLSASFRNVSMQSREYGLLAALEWALPAAVIIYIIAKPILDGFLQEIGAGGSRRLRTTLGKIFTKVKQRNLRWASLSDVERELAKIKEEKRHLEEDKPLWIPSAGHPAPVLSVEVELENTYSSAKFVFSHELDESALLNALESLSVAVARATAEARSWQEMMKRDPAFRGIRPITYVYRLDLSDWMQVFPTEEDKRDWQRAHESLGI